MWFAYANEGMNWYQLSTDRVHDIIQENKKGNKVASLEEFVFEEKPKEKNDFSDAVGQDSLTRFDTPKKSNRRRRKKRRNKNKQRNRNSKKNA